MATSRSLTITALYQLLLFCNQHSSSIILDEQTSNLQVCRKPNTIYKFCQSAAQPTCKDQHPIYRTNNCLDGCFCKNGFVLNDRNACIKPENCPGTEKHPSFWWLFPKSCDNTCMKTCATRFLDVTYFCSCQQRKCDIGKMLDEKTGKCISPENCNAQNYLCPKNMEYHCCKNSTKSCLGYTGNVSEVRFKQYLPKCYCKEGLVENLNDGTCIQPEDCPTIECPRNQTYFTSPQCRRSCMNYFQNIPPTEDFCAPGCYCSEGYTLNAKNQCVLVHDCPEKELVCGEKQYIARWQVRKTCRDLNGMGFQTNGCFCNSGLVYDEDRRVCIHPGECPNSQERKTCEDRVPNSEFKSCQQKELKYCDGEVIPKLDNDNCIPGCYCKPGFYHQNGQCVTDCSIKRPGNSINIGNANNCERTCGNMLLKEQTCNDKNDENRCKNNYVMNSKGQCVLPKDCPLEEIICPSHSSFSECNRNLVRTCQDGRILKVKDVEAVNCSWGCFCDDPFIYDKLSATCVHPNECPLGEANKACRSKDQNSEFKMCTRAITATCDNRYSTSDEEDCDKPGCQCISGTYLNDMGKCVFSDVCAKDDIR